MSLGTDVWCNLDHVTSFLKTDHYICLSLSLTLFFFHRERARDSDPRISPSNAIATPRREYDGKTAAS